MLKYVFLWCVLASPFCQIYAVSDTTTTYLLSWTTRDRWIQNEWPYRIIELSMGRFFTHASMMAMPSDWTLEVRDNQILILDEDAKPLHKAHPQIKHFYYETYPFYLPSYWQAWERDLSFYANLDNTRLAQDDLILEAVAVGNMPTAEVTKFHEDPENIRFTALRLPSKTWKKITLEAGYTPEQVNRACIRKDSRKIFLATLRSKNIGLTPEEEAFIDEYWDRLKAASSEVKKLSLLSYNCLKKASDHLLGLLGPNRAPKALIEFSSLNKKEPYPLLKQLEKEGYPVTYSVQTDPQRQIILKKDQPVSHANPWNLYGILTGKFLDV